VRAGSPGRWWHEGRRCGVFPPLLRANDRIRVNFRRVVLVIANLVRCAPGYLLFLYHSATRAHNHGSVGAPDQGARSNGDGDLVPFRWAPVGVNPTESSPPPAERRISDRRGSDLLRARALGGDERRPMRGFLLAVAFASLGNSGRSS
jgi:hypothetical protein